MPYYIYKQFQNRKLEYIDAHEKFRDAKLDAREKRNNLAEDAGYAVKIMFASNEKQAELLLKEEREARPLGDD
jgi:hypothetical protein